MKNRQLQKTDDTTLRNDEQYSTMTVNEMNMLFEVDGDQNGERLLQIGHEKFQNQIG